MSWPLDVAPHWHYAFILGLCLLMTAPLEWVIGARVYRRPRRLAIALLASIPFVLWDIWATHIGTWWFSPEYTLGVSLAGLPLEEIGFFVVIPICGLLTYEAVRTLWDRVRP